jgi:hypothetical protein
LVLGSIQSTVPISAGLAEAELRWLAQCFGEVLEAFPSSSPLLFSSKFCKNPSELPTKLLNAQLAIFLLNTLMTKPCGQYD